MGSNIGLNENEVRLVAGRPVVKKIAGDEELIVETSFSWISWRGRDGEELFPSWSEMEFLFFCEDEDILVSFSLSASSSVQPIGGGWRNPVAGINHHEI
jgi:hypothetical protein